MKLALLLLLDEAKREGVPLTGIMPRDQATALFKSVVGLGGGEILKGMPHLCLWDSGGGQKVHKMKPGVPVALPPELKKRAGEVVRVKALQGEVKELTGALESVTGERDAAVQALEEMKARLEEAVAEKLRQAAGGEGEKPGAVSVEKQGQAVVPPAGGLGPVVPVKKE